MYVVPTLLVNLIFCVTQMISLSFLFADRDFGTFPSEVPTKKLGICSINNPDPRPRLVPLESKMPVLV